ncbi:hypothetical protein IRJ41_018776, partial [Triplophysa rosa]
RSSLVILSLWIFISIEATTQDVCPEPPKIENAQISRDSVKSNYSNGDEIDYSCNNGYVSLRKITYMCRNKKWSQHRSAECTLKRCELPADIPNGHYTIINGNSFVVGSTIKYTCEDGYQMMNRIFTRTCRPGGWDNQLPVCEEVSCAADVPSDKFLKMEGLPDYGDLIRHGHRLQFSCTEQGYALKGPKEITCQSNGEWDEKFPHCEEITCKLNETKDFGDKVERISDHVGLIKPGHQIKLSCVEQGMIIRDKRPIICQENGEWNIPFPKCEEAKCVANITNMIIDRRPNPGVIEQKPGETIKVSCHQEFVLEGKKDITCQEDGEWSSQFPSCVATTCEPPPTLSHLNADTKLFLDSKKTKYSLEEKVEYACFQTYIMEGDPFVICKQGTWREQFKCIPPCLASVEKMDKRNIELKKGGRERMYCPHMDHITFVCQKGTYKKGNSVQFRQQCLYGEMTLPECE